MTDSQWLGIKRGGLAPAALSLVAVIACGGAQPAPPAAEMEMEAGAEIKAGALAPPHPAFAAFPSIPVRSCGSSRWPGHESVSSRTFRVSLSNTSCTQEFTLSPARAEATSKRRRSSSLGLKVSLPRQVFSGSAPSSLHHAR